MVVGDELAVAKAAREVTRQRMVALVLREFQFHDIRAATCRHRKSRLRQQLRRSRILVRRSNTNTHRYFRADDRRTDVQGSSQHAMQQPRFALAPPGMCDERQRRNAGRRDLAHLTE